MFVELLYVTSSITVVLPWLHCYLQEWSRW